jgi:hypothetical protein
MTNINDQYQYQYIARCYNILQDVTSHDNNHRDMIQYDSMRHYNVLFYHTNIYSRIIIINTRIFNYLFKYDNNTNWSSMHECNVQKKNWKDIRDISL